jgi:hypothetical protein
MGLKRAKICWLFGGVKDARCWRSNECLPPCVDATVASGKIAA